MVTLKRLRKFKGFTQEQCANIVGVPLRTYQNYENDPEKAKTYKYYEIMKKLYNYGRPIDDEIILSDSDYSMYNTKVITDNKLLTLIDKVKTYEKRECYSLLENYINNDYRGNVCCLYGLRRTGKTTLLLQLAASLPINEVAYIDINYTDSMGLLTSDLDKLHKKGYKYIFIDEITLLEDFINAASPLSDIYSMMGLKIILSGTDSLGFKLAEKKELYDRILFIHTTHISFKEFSILLSNNSIEDYIEYGGTLLKENITFDEKEKLLKGPTFKNKENTHKYIDSAIAENIQNSILKDTNGSRYSRLKQLYNEDELTNVINRIIEDMNHEFTLKVIERKFKSNDLGSAKELITKHNSLLKEVLSRIDIESVLEKFKSLVNIKEKEELNVIVEKYHIEEIKRYLFQLDLIYKSEILYEDGEREENIIFTQPGMRYSLAKALVHSLFNDSYFSSIDKKDREYIISKILEDVKGRMLEDIIVLELSKKTKEYHSEVVKYISEDGEIDCIYIDHDNCYCDLFEIKRSDKIVDNQARHLNNEKIKKIIEQKFGNIRSKNIIYRGISTTRNDIRYINVEEFLVSL